jgi:hypothetical protein
MASIAEVIDFLMNLMRDDDTRREFDQDPDTVLADRGLGGVTGEDVRDARLLMADCGSVAPRAAARAERGSSSHDAVHEIHYTTTNFEVGDVTTTVVTINDNDTLIVDSFNPDVTAIQDNDTTDVDVISIVDNDNDNTDTSGDESGEEAAGPEGEPGDESDPPSAEGADEPPVSSEEELDGDLESGASEGFAPDQDSGFGAQPELGTEAGFTAEADASAADPFDELAG